MELGGVGWGSIPDKGNTTCEGHGGKWAFQVPGTERNLKCLEYSKPREKTTRGEDGEKGTPQKAWGLCLRISQYLAYRRQSTNMWKKWTMNRIDHKPSQCLPYIKRRKKVGKEG